jgi:hypothetical protein
MLKTLIDHHREAVELEEGILATTLPAKALAYATGRSIGLTKVFKYPVKHSNWLESWADSFDEVNFTPVDVALIRGRRSVNK